MIKETEFNANTDIETRDPLERTLWDIFGSRQWKGSRELHFSIKHCVMNREEEKLRINEILSNIVQMHINERNIICNHNTNIVYIQNAPLMLVTILPIVDKGFKYKVNYNVVHNGEVFATFHYVKQPKDSYNSNTIQLGITTEMELVNKEEDVKMSEVFGKALKETMLSEDYNQSVTENGALGYATTGKELLDMNFMVSSLRKVSEENIMNQFSKVFFEDKLLAIKFLFFAGDVRGGMGERRLFRICFKWLSMYSKAEAKALLFLVPEYTRWDNLISIVENGEASEDVLERIFDLMDEQLKEDKENMEEKKPISLLAKWLPSPSTKNVTKRKFMKKFLSFMKWDYSEYRKCLSSLRSYLDLTEIKISKNQWDKVDYEKVPSCANVMYSKAFKRHDAERRNEYIASVMKGEKKINAGVLMPSDIAKKYFVYHRVITSEKDDSLEALWNNLKDYIEGKGDTISVLDTSGSMFNNKTKDGTPIAVIAFSIAIYFMQRTSGYFKDKVITFSERPKFLDLCNCGSLFDYLNFLKAYSEYADTNIEAVFDLLLEAAVRNHLPQEEIPRNILILSDMEFNECATSNYSHGYGLPSNLFVNIQKKWEVKGYKLPRLVFWNIYSRTNTIPIRSNDLGVALVSGFNPSIMDMVLSSETDPYKNLLRVLNGERYKPIEDVLSNL